MPATGMGPSGLERAISNPAAAPPPSLQPSAGPTEPVTGDSVAAQLNELSQSGLTRLLEILNRPRSGDDARVDQLLRTAEEAVAARNTGGALDLLRQVASLDPARAETTLSAPELASIRANWEQLLNQLSATAKLHAGSRLTEATQSLEMAAVKETCPGEVRPEILLAVAARLIEAGGLANYVRSTAVSEAVIDRSRWAPAEPAVDIRQAAGGRAKVPLPIAAWLVLGSASAALCWWVREEYLPAVCGVWVAVLVVLIVARAWQRPPRA